MGDEIKGYTFSDKRGETNQDYPGSSSMHKDNPGTSEDILVHKDELKIDFSTLIMSFASAAMISLGAVPDPETGRISRDLDLARQNIDILSLLQTKTRGNLSPEEERLIEGFLYELRICYVEAERGEE